MRKWTAHRAKPAHAPLAIVSVFDPVAVISGGTEGNWIRYGIAIRQSWVRMSSSQAVARRRSMRSQLGEDSFRRLIHKFVHRANLAYRCNQRHHHLRHGPHALSLHAVAASRIALTCFAMISGWVIPRRGRDGSSSDSSPADPACARSCSTP
jgi:hypothetical protein